MPNHVTNILTASATVIAALKGASLVDFNSLIPMPPAVRDTKAESRSTCLAELITGKTNVRPKPGDLVASLTLSNAIQMLESGGIKTLVTDEDFENFVTMLRNFRSHGALCWYDWAVDHWGTKWNAYDIKETADGVQFETAWSAPHPVIKALAAKHPDEKIVHRWADEDIGSNLGTRVYHFGTETDIEINDRVDFALTITGSDREYYRLNATSGKWEYYDADEASEGGAA